jgi:hypothetical protein
VLGVGGTAGVRGESTSGHGLHGVGLAADRAAVLGAAINSATGVFGFSGQANPPASPVKTGVYGYAAQDGTACGVHGETTAGSGIKGIATDGNGVVGSSYSGASASSGRPARARASVATAAPATAPTA